MEIIKFIQEVIDMRRELSENGFMPLIRRKGDQEEELEDIYTGDRTVRGPDGNAGGKGKIYDLLSKEADKEELLKFWNDFHSQFSYPDFSTFYSKRVFCSPLSLGEGPLQSISERDFISLLADRKFLFLEDNEHGNNPEYPPLSEIVRDPKLYLPPEKTSEQVNAGQRAYNEIRENAKLVCEQGLVPTRAHKRAYNELKRNTEAIRAALQQRRDFIRRSSEFLKDGIPKFQPFTIPISQSKDEPTELDRELSQLLHDYLYAARHTAYKNGYGSLLKDVENKSLAAITCVTQYLNSHPDIPVSKAYIIWLLFTNETTKLANGKLKVFIYRDPKVKSEFRLTSGTPAITSRMIHCKNKLFDYLLKILPPEKEDNEVELAYAKFQYHVLTGYNGYTHFRTGNINLKSLSRDPETSCKYDFNLIPDSNDCTDYLGGIIRHHIQCCISNDVRWLTPGLPNNWNINSSILATLLLQDSAYFPKARRLTNRIYAFLNGDKGKECTKAYMQLKGGQSELIEHLNRWCSDNDLIFEGDIPSSDMIISDDKMKLLCSRLVLEYMLKERELQVARKTLAVVAHKLWGDILIGGYETFDLEDGN